MLKVALLRRFAIVCRVAHYYAYDLGHVFDEFFDCIPVGLDGLRIDDPIRECPSPCPPNGERSVKKT